MTGEVVPVAPVPPPPGVERAQARVSRGARHGPATVWSTVLGEFPTEPVTSEAHPYSPQARARRRFLYRRPVRSRDVAVLVQRL
ncbi:hypothetical protein Taro_005200 [Colocasia esculenta]|uniref:Uncharacterized protein n=1 Tax=Colocasia esculenta TaxID=4460 RepID=A0A843TME4_COLES|nr:hypothetical protein [Colocasia esculenta]